MGNEAKEYEALKAAREMAAEESRPVIQRVARVLAARASPLPRGGWPGDEIVEQAAKKIALALDDERDPSIFEARWRSNLMLYGQSAYRKAARAVLSLPVEQAGWRLVPEKPTDEMAAAGLEALQEQLGHTAVIVRDPVFCYRAMVNAAPQPHQIQQDGGGE